MNLLTPIAPERIFDFFRSAVDARQALYAADGLIGQGDDVARATERGDALLAYRVAIDAALDKLTNGTLIIVNGAGIT